MSPTRTLLVYYSRSGHTRQVARELAKALSADLEEIHEPEDRLGTLGYLKSALEAIWGASVEIGRPELDPGGYDLVVVGTPVWYASVSSPVRTYLWLERDRLPRVAFFLTHGGFGSDRVFGHMRALAGKRAVAELALRVREIESGSYADKLSSFATSLLSRALPPRAGGVRKKVTARGGRKGAPRKDGR